MAITVQRTNNVTMTKSDLTAAILSYLKRNNVEGADQTAGNYTLVIPAEGLNGANDTDVVISLALPLSP